MANIATKNGIHQNSQIVIVDDSLPGPGSVTIDGDSQSWKNGVSKFSRNLENIKLSEIW